MGSHKRKQISDNKAKQFWVDKIADVFGYKIYIQNKDCVWKYEAILQFKNIATRVIECGRCGVAQKLKIDLNF